MTVLRDPDFNGWLDICRDAAYEGLYFLGPRQSRITFYNQQVRALQLVHALSRTGRLGENERVAVVGAGAGGVTAAIAFALAGAQVTLYDSAADILQLQSASPRLLHPHIYEWPAMGSLDDQAGLPILDWMSGSAGDVAASLTTVFKAASTHFGTRLRFQPGSRLNIAEPAGAGWRLWFEGVTDPKSFSKAVLALGFGKEDVYSAAEPQAYWKGGGVEAASIEPISNARCFVSGKGDGGLTDLLAHSISGFQHVAFAREFLGRFIDDALTRAAEAVWQGKKTDDDLEPDFERHVLPVLKEADVLAWLGQRLRSDRTFTLNSSAPLFANGRAARLNQTMVYALLKAAEAATPVSCMSGYIDDVVADGEGAKVQFRDGSPAPIPSSRVICRHGPRTDALYAVAETPYKAHLQRVQSTLVEKPELGGPISLHPATFDHFERLNFDQLHTDAEVHSLDSAAARRKTVIRIDLDQASHRLSERGATRLAEIAERCERGEACEIHLAVPPAKVPRAVDLIRLAQASDGKITLTASPEVRGSWALLSTSIAEKPAPGPGYRPVSTETSSLCRAIDNCLLRLLDTGLSLVFTTNKDALLGTISAEIVAGMRTTWENWRSDLTNDPGLRARFLTWLYSVDPRAETPWTGVHSEATDLVSALVLTLATHLGQPLRLLEADRSEQGNLALGTGSAVALGSGCRVWDGAPVWERSDPTDWDVDALILSGVGEMTMIEPTDRVMGSDGLDLREARRVRPAMILNESSWRRPLRAGLADWLAAVQAEFTALKQRQDNLLRKAMK